MQIWGEVRIYDEPGFDRKIRLEDAETLLEDGGFFAEPRHHGELMRSQIEDLIAGLPLAERHREVLRLRLDGLTLRETAERLGVTHQRIERIWARLRMLPRSLTELEALMVPGRVPQYGWQEVYLDSMRRG